MLQYEPSDCGTFELSNLRIIDTQPGRLPHMQIVGGCNSLLKCASLPEITKNSLKPFILGGSKSFKVIDVDISKKLVTSACYDKQHVCVYLQPFSR